MTPSDLSCWRCGAGLPEQPLPIGRRDECPKCRADLHACRMCRFYDPSVARACREPVADEVADKERANFCGYLEPRAAAGAGLGAGRAGADAARAKLADLFGEAPPPGAEGGGTSEADEARRRLERLFGTDDETE